MGQLFFKKAFFPAIREGRKVTTVRRWSSARVRAGQRVFTPGLGWLDVESVEEIELESLSEADSHADGFANLSDMMLALREMYPPGEGEGRKWFRVRFKFNAEVGTRNAEQKTKTAKAAKTRQKK